MNAQENIGKCGFYCGSCPTYRAGDCQGCLKEHKKGDCFTHDCVLEKGLPYCGCCKEFPCDDLMSREKATVLDKDWLQWKRRQRRP